MRRILTALLLVLYSSVLFSQSVTAPAVRSYDLSTANQDASGFVLSGFSPTATLLASVAFINPPIGTTFTLTTTGLTAASGFTLSGAKTTLVFTGTQTNINTALNTLKVSTGATAGNVQVSVSATINPTGFFYNGVNGHFYQPVPSGNTYTGARAASLLATFKGQKGYLVTITSANEDAFIFNNVPQSNIWFAATDEVTDGRWVIDAGPEKGTVMKTVNGQLYGNIPGVYNNWAGGEPNGSNHSEDYAVTKWNGSQWNDLSNDWTNPYVIEYGTWVNPSDQTFTEFYSANIINPIKVVTSKVNFYFGGGVNPAQWSIKSYTANGVTAVSATNGLGLGINGSVVNTTDYNKNKTDMVLQLSNIPSNTLSSLYANAITISDAFTAFQEVSNKGLSGTESGNVFSNGIQFINGDVDGNNTFDEKDSYKILQHVMGTSPIVSTWSESNIFRLIDKSVFDGITKGNWKTTNVPYGKTFPLVVPTNALSNDYVYNIVVGVKGDVNLSHTPTQNLTTTQSIGGMNRVVVNQIEVYISTELVGGKVFLTIKVNPLSQQLKGTQFKVHYDTSILKFDTTVFTTSGKPINFSTPINNYINIGSLIQTEFGTMDKNTEYILSFIPTQPITNTLGLVSVEGVDAVNQNGESLNIKSL